MSNSSLSQAERTAVRAKLFGKEGGGVTEQFTKNADGWATDNVANALYKVFVENDVAPQLELNYLNQLEEDAETKYQVRVTDKNGKVYTRTATRSKITQLRQNPNIKSVEMSDHGEPYEGERTKGTQTAKAKGGGKLDPVGKEDSDVDNDGDVDKSDKYLLKRRKAIGSAIKTRAEAFIADGTISTEPKNKTKISGQGVDNYKSGAVKVAPDDKSAEASQNAARGSVYASFAHQSMLATLAEKKACSAKKKAEKINAYYAKEDSNYGYDKDGKSLNPKDKEEEKKDMRGYYAKINVIKNKLRSVGAKNPCVLADPDDVEKNWDKDKKDDAVKEGAALGRAEPKPLRAEPKPLRAEPKPLRDKRMIGGPKTKKPAPPKVDGPKTEKPKETPKPPSTKPTPKPPSKSPTPPKQDPPKVDGPKTEKPQPPRNPRTKPPLSDPAVDKPKSKSKSTDKPMKDTQAEGLVAAYQAIYEKMKDNQAAATAGAAGGATVGGEGTKTVPNPKTIRNPKGGSTQKGKSVEAAEAEKELPKPKAPKTQGTPTEPKKQGGTDAPKQSKDKGRYNPFKDGRIPKGSDVGP
tara:strand:+ start:6 stop:1736 length:1731 start_codon:yes stop_codon:yes gene_type:complete